MKYHKELYEYLDSKGFLYLEGWLVTTASDGKGYNEVSLKVPNRYGTLTLGICNDNGFRPHFNSEGRVDSWNKSNEIEYLKHVKLQKLIDKI